MLTVEKTMKAGQFVLRKAAARGGWKRMSKKGRKGRRGKLSNEELDDEVIGVETGSELDSEEDERRKGKKSVKGKVRTREVHFENKGKRKEDGQEKVNELTRKLLQLNVKDDTYAATYMQLFVLAPGMTDNFPPPSHFRASTMAATITTVAPSYPRYSQPRAPMPCDFSCYFCKKPDCQLNMLGQEELFFIQMDITLTQMGCQSMLAILEDSKGQLT